MPERGRTRAISTCCAATSAPLDARRRQGRRRLRRQLPAGPAVGARAPATCSTRAPACRTRSSTPAGLTDMRTGAVTAIGAKHLARKGSKVLGHIGARGTAYWNVRLLDRLFDFDEIRVHSRRPESRDAFAARLSRDLGKPVDGHRRLARLRRGADIVVEASRLHGAGAAARRPSGSSRAPRRALRHDERGRALAHRHHGQDRRRRLGPVQEPGRSARCARTSRRASSRRRRCTPSWARSSPAGSRAASATTRRSCSGTAACRCPTSRSAPRCSTRRRGSASANACATPDRK